MVKNPRAMWETWVQSLGWEDPLEKGKATHSSILAWRIPWTAHRVAKSQTRLSDAKTRGFHTQLDEGPETPRATREASGVLQETERQNLKIVFSQQPESKTGPSSQLNM